MLVEESFKKFQIKLDDNFETAKIAVERGRYVILFNESQNRFFETIIKGGNDTTRYAQKLLVKDYKILNTQKKDYEDYFKLPDNFFEFSSAYSTASTNNCDTQKMYLFEIKDANSQEILTDEFNKPSFIARESPFDFSSDNIVLYNDNNFTHEELYLSYYRYPTQITLLDMDDPESQFNESHKIDFDDKIVDRIISNAVAEMKKNYGDPSFQINQQ